MTGDLRTAADKKRMPTESGGLVRFKSQGYQRSCCAPATLLIGFLIACFASPATFSVSLLISCTAPSVQAVGTDGRVWLPF
jgi:hypothetical protein